MHETKSKISTIIIIGVLIAAAIWILFTLSARATEQVPQVTEAPEKVCINHCERVQQQRTIQCQLLELPIPAARRHIQNHDLDSRAVCPTDEPDPTDEPEPTKEPDPTDPPNNTDEPSSSSEENGGEPGDETDCSNLDALTEEQALNECGESKVKEEPKTTVTSVGAPVVHETEEVLVKFPSTGFSIF